VSLFETQLANVDRRSSAIMGYQWSGRINTRPVGASAGIAGGVYPTADGHVEVTAAGGNYWKRFAAMVGEPLTDPKYTDPAAAANPATKEEVDAVTYPWMLGHTSAEVWEQARARHSLTAPVTTGAELWNDRVLHERGTWTEVEHAVLGKFPMLGRPFHFEKTPWRIRQAAPMLGQHTDAILGEIGKSGNDIAALRASGAVA
jgi:crotonobetainyl-CoA:carnitine CoA-transferase CaiB-like acyl-CoA transferase